MTGNPVGGPPPRSPDTDRSVGELAFDVTERVSILVREEIELAKVEVTEKATNLAKGSAVGIAAGVFILLALAMLMHAIAWGINDILGIEGSIWVGFLIETFIWLIVAGIAGFVAYRFVQKGSPPKPAMAIEEAKETKATLGKVS
ncbi:MAG: phage holin family protein [Actinomycetota bacterium]|nr:phage holin family protein [Actinomycetota bacterium]